MTEDPTLQQAAAPSGWPHALADRLFTAPPRWGWRFVDTPVPDTPPGLSPQYAPQWEEPPRPDTSELRRALLLASGRLAGWVALTLAATFAFLRTRPQVAGWLAAEGFSSGAYPTYHTFAILGLLALAASIVPRLGAFLVAVHNLSAFQRPYRQARAAQRRQYERAAAEWDRTVAEHYAARAQAQARRLAADLWHPVHPAAEPTRIDVLGGDPHRHGWASLLVTLGTSVLAGRERIAMLDFTGRDVAGGLAEVAQAGGYPVRRVDLPAVAARVNLLAGLGEQNLAECLGYTLSGSPETGEDPHVRALATELVQRMVGCLDGPVTLCRLAAAVRVLRRLAPGPTLSPAEVAALVDLIGEVSQDDWSVKHLQLIGIRLGLLAELEADRGPAEPIWSAAAVNLVATAGGHGDRKDLVDRLLLRLTQDLMHRPRRLADLLVVAGADRLGAAPLQLLSDHARTAGMRLLLMIDQPQGDLEGTVGTGGAVCVMKMYNHRDAEVAASFIGRGHRFVLSQLTRDVSRSFTDAVMDGFIAGTDRGASSAPGRVGLGGPATALSQARGHTWIGTRAWSTAQQLGSASTTSRVYEFTVDPHEIQAMPETAFILVDNSRHGRRIVMADSNPGICLSDRVAASHA